MVIYIKKLYILTFTFILILIRIFYISIYQKEYYKKELTRKTQFYTYSLSSPRGRILDTNGKVLVDNIKKRVIIYEKNSNITNNMELLVASTLSKYISKNVTITDDDKALYIYSKDSDIKKYLSSNDYDNLTKSIITVNEAKNKALKYIKENLINNLSNEELKTAYIYSLMNKDYKYDKKIIFNNVDDDLYFKILNENIPGIKGEYIYERVYPYGYKSIYGSVGKIDKSDMDTYLTNGYLITDDVGKSYLEKEYESTLKGGKATYKVNSDGSYKLVKEEKKGSDITLNIDIEIDKKVENTLKKYIVETKGKVNTEYYDGSYVIIGKPTGEIISLVGLKLGEDLNFIESSKDVSNLSFTVGSVVKAASNTVAYKENAIIKNKKILDSCVKLYMNTKKCSYKPLGYVDDISALEKSSNYYQYINALKIMGYNNYSYNMKVKVDKSSFDKYRNIFKEYGLGDKTYIDLPSESLGIEGSIISPDLLLNLSIGQYDSYTPLMLLSYINTIALNGKRYNLMLKENKGKVVSNVEISQEDLNRIKKGLNNVVNKGTGRGYIYQNNGAGKTGTSETLYDSNNDGLYETKTITTSFVGYMPYDNPVYTFIIISPNISSNKSKTSYKVPINRYIISEITSFLFENI